MKNPTPSLFLSSVLGLAVVFTSSQVMEFAELIKTPRVDGVVLHRPFMPIVEGTLCLTGHHLILSSRQDNTEELWLLHSNIDSIEKR